MSRPGRVLGLDLGSKRIGVAVTDDAQMLATGVGYVARGRSRADDHEAIRALVADYAAVGVVVGVPYSASGAVGPAAGAALAEIAELQECLGVAVHGADERFTTVVAAGGLRAAGRPARRQRQVVDRAAAAEILQGWLERRKSTAGE